MSGSCSNSAASVGGPPLVRQVHLVLQFLRKLVDHLRGAVPQVGKVRFHHLRQGPQNLHIHAGHLADARPQHLQHNPRAVMQPRPVHLRHGARRKRLGIDRPKQPVDFARELLFKRLPDHVVADPGHLVLKGVNLRPLAPGPAACSSPAWAYVCGPKPSSSILSRCASVNVHAAPAMPTRPARDRSCEQAQLLAMSANPCRTTIQAPACTVTCCTRWARRSRSY
jgi:hypothetical protein